MNLWQLPSFKYRHQLKQLVEPLKSLPYFGGFALAILLKSGKSTWMSSTPKVSVRNAYMGFSRGDLLLDEAFVSQHALILPALFMEKDALQQAIDTNLKQAGIYRAYCFSRTCRDCTILVSVNTNVQIENPLAYAQQTLAQMELFSIHFLEAMLSAYVEALPELAQTRFATDTEFRKRILQKTNTPLQSLKLNESERAILYWSAQGKSAEEIAGILHLTKNTVDSYRRGLLEKLDVANITQAVYVASNIGLIV